MVAESNAIFEFVRKKADEAHADTWKHSLKSEFKNGVPVSVEWKLAKERELLCGEILRFIEGGQ